MGQIENEVVAGRKYYFVSLAFYGHQVYKCAGFGAERPEHREFFLPHFEKFGGSLKGQGVDQGPFKVIILDDEGLNHSDFVLEDGTPISYNEAQKLRMSQFKACSA